MSRPFCKAARNGSAAGSDGLVTGSDATLNTSRAAVTIPPPAAREATTGTRRAPRVYGVDPSLTATGIAGDGWTDRVGSDGHNADPLGVRWARIRAVADTAWMYTRHADLVVIEGPSFGSSGSGTFDRSGLWWRMVGRWCEAEIPLLVIPPSTLKVYATGNGRADKAAVLAAVREWYPWFYGDHNEADALALWTAGMALLGRPPIDLPTTHTRALRALSLPETALDWRDRP